MPNICEKHTKEDCAECLAEVAALAAANPVVPTGTETCVYHRPGEPLCGRTAITVGVADARCDKHITGDMRTLPELPFAIDSKPDERAEVAEKVRTILGYAGVLIADDIDALGCTGLYAKARANRDGLAEAHTLALADAQFVKANIGGAGKGLPCFVPPNLYCLVHDTVGAWHQGQPKDPQVLEHISRELTQTEAEHAGLVKKAQKAGRNEAGAVLMTGPEYEEHGPAVEEPPTTEPPVKLTGEVSYSCSFCGKTREQVKKVIVGPQVNICDECVGECNKVIDKEEGRTPRAPSSRRGREVDTFECPEHDTPQWGCMQCLAEMLAGGADLEPTFIIMPAAVGDPKAVAMSIKAAGIDGQLEAWTAAKNEDGSQVMAVDLFVKIAGWRRKLARE